MNYQQKIYCRSSRKNIGLSSVRDWVMSSVEDCYQELNNIKEEKGSAFTISYRYLRVTGRSNFHY